MSEKWSVLEVEMYICIELTSASGVIAFSTSLSAVAFSNSESSLEGAAVSPASDMVGGNVIYVCFLCRSWNPTGCVFRRSIAWLSWTRRSDQCSRLDPLLKREQRLSCTV